MGSLKRCDVHGETTGVLVAGEDIAEIIFEKKRKRKRKRKKEQMKKSLKKELTFQNKEKENPADALALAKKEITSQNKEK
jgi:hypothetical protein